MTPLWLEAVWHHRYRMSFVHLHRHSEFSRLDGLGTAEQYAQEAARLGQGALAQTDHGTLSGALHHIVACQKAGITPVSGVEAYFRPIRSNKATRKAWHLCLFAKNLTGWHNLLRIVSKAYSPVEDGGGFYQYPCVDMQLLRDHREGIVCSTACVSSWLAELVENGFHRAVDSYIDEMLTVFGDDFWIEIMPHDFNDQRLLNDSLVAVANDRSIPLIATNDAHFPYQEWADTHVVARLMGTRSSFQKAERDRAEGKATYLADLYPTLYLCGEADMRRWFADHHPRIGEAVVSEAIANTELFVERMEPFVLSKEEKLPKISASPSETERILRGWIEEGLGKIAARGVLDFSVYEGRVEHEWEVLKAKGVLDYFLLVGEVVRWAKGELIRVGLGRGSAAGCLISYLIGITAIDPIAYGLLFERFINPARKGLPDIDLDFQSDKRHLVKQHIAQKYGEDHVADIITHTTFQPKKVIKDVCRVYSIDIPYAQEVVDSIDIRQDDEETTLEEILPLNETLQRFKSEHPDVWEHAVRLEGSVANAGKHAAGIIITPEPVVEYMALERGKKGDLVTSWSDAANFPVVSDYGFVKLDALGIRGLTKHGYACQLIGQQHGVDMDLNALPVMWSPYATEDDVMAGFREGRTIGVFQFGGSNITAFLRQVQPTSILDLTAVNALYRPGPLGGNVAWEFPTRKRNPFMRLYWHELVRPILAETYGVVAFQEQVMEIAKAIGGFSGAEADDMRKAMGKLYRIKGGTAARDYMRQFEEKWFAGAQERGVERAVADEIWQKMLEFGHYGFNKSHSASYALQAYQDMYLKVKYPAEFYASFLTFEDDEAKRKTAIREAQALGLVIRPPDVNRSSIGWAVDQGELLFGLIGIDGVGPVAAASIVKNAPYDTFPQFKERNGNKCNKRVIEALTQAGAFDRFGGRKEYMERRDRIINWERSRLKMSLTYVDDVVKYASVIETHTDTQHDVEVAAIGTEMQIGGEITRVSKGTTKRGDPYAIIKVIFGANEFRVNVWVPLIRRIDALLKEGNCVMVRGHKDKWRNYHSVTADDIIETQLLAIAMERQEAMAA